MREKYESLSVAVLRDLAKTRGITGVTTMRKNQLVEAMLAQDELDAAKQEKASAKMNANKQASGNDEHAETIESRTTRRTRPSKKTSQEDSAVGEESATTKRAQKATSAAHKTEERHAQAKGRASESGERQERPNRPEQAHHAGSPERRRTEHPEIPADELQVCGGILEVMADGFGFIRSDNYLPGSDDVYVAPAQIRKFSLRTGDVLAGYCKRNGAADKYSALIQINTVNDVPPEVAARRTKFEDLTPIFPDERIRLEQPHSSVAMRLVDLVSPIGKGQRGMIVSQPKAGKTTLLKEIARSVTKSYPQMYLIILLIDERPEEVTDIREAITGENVEVIYSTFDELPEHHKRVSEMTIERAKRLVEQKKDVMILLDSITRLARAYNLTVPPSGRTLSGGLDPAALHMPKKFFGAARNMREGGSLTILATALVDTGSKMDDVVYEEFKGTGNMELILDRKLSEKRVFPAIDIVKSGTRRDDLLFTKEERDAVEIMRRGFNGMRKDDSVESVLNLFAHTHSNKECIAKILNRRMV